MKKTTKIINEIHLSDQTAFKNYVASDSIADKLQGRIKEKLSVNDSFEAIVKIIPFDEVKPVVPAQPLASIRSPVEPTEPLPPIPIQPPASQIVPSLQNLI